MSPTGHGGKPAKIGVSEMACLRTGRIFGLFRGIRPLALDTLARLQLGNPQDLPE
jgi:hypothetical protein